MYSPIHRELGAPFTTPLDWQLLQKAVEAKLPEQRDLDFKVQPSLLDLKILEIQAPSGGVCMALLVPPSDYFPHLCVYDKHNDPLPFFAPV